MFSKSEGLESDSWIVQCEILHHKLLGDGPQMEDLVPDLPVGDGALFDFFGLGQPSARPAQIDEDQEDQEEDQPQDHQW